MAKTNRRIHTVALSILCALVLALAATSPVWAQKHWVGSWTASQQIPEPNNALPPADLTDCTLRQIVHLSLGGNELRVRLSNRFGIAPLLLAAVHVAKPVSAASPKTVPGTDHTLTFLGSTEVTIPAGADYVSDPIAFAAAPLSNLAITIYMEAPPARQTGHPGSRATSYLVHGNHVADGDLPDAKTVEHWYFISGVDVQAAEDAASIVTLGDSITDGHASTTNGNDRWPDVLAERLQASAETRNLAVLNVGTGGNRMLLDGLGPNAVARLDADVLAQPGVRSLIVLEGVNDLGMMTREGDVPKTEHEAIIHQIEAAYEQILARAHAHGIEVIGGTITPFVGSAFYHPGPNTEADRQAINQWIRASGHFDAVIDFDKVMRDPAHPDRLNPKLECGDHLHPSPAGYAAMADAIPLSLFTAHRKSAAAARASFERDEFSFLAKVAVHPEGRPALTMR
ncbi:MAG TPA: SGNH/GDSL hydrolase family protein [Candidatus Acidoferrales bacterium]|nr:SGNH/GDSL hydrolase family protein [Candidatus Acidoferrales bacterium]